VDRFELGYKQASDGLPTIDDLMQVPIALGLAGDVAVAPAGDVTPWQIRLAEVPGQAVHSFHHTAIRAIDSQILAKLHERNIVGVIVQPHPDDIDAAGVDLRPPGVATLRLVIRVARVARIRTTAVGDRIPDDERTNHPAHERLRRLSPVGPVAEGDQSGRDLIRKDLFDNYLYQVNRHVGRNVDVAVEPADGPDQVALDLLVAEAKPLLVYGQTSNTGTENTALWRWRFGLMHSQLTGRDDVLSLDYITTALCNPESEALVGSYEAPLGEGSSADFRGLRFRGFGSWSQFDASEVGLGDASFTGKNWTAGGELIEQLWQYEDLFIDVLAGARFQSIDVEGTTTNGREQLLIPHVGLRLERSTKLDQLDGSLTLDMANGGLTGADNAGLTRLGRFAADENWTLMTWGLSYSFYLEPALAPRAWMDVSTPASSTLAHELSLRCRGQSSMGRRLIPQHQQVVGGLYSVRGYPESVVAGDNVMVANVEYRFHVPRTFAIEPDPSKTPLFGRPFRWAPQQLYGRPDWDLIFKTFLDVAVTGNSDRQPTERDETLVGTGVGVEVMVRRNLSARLDWGVALSKVNAGMSDQVNAGDHRLHLVFTLLY